MTDPDCNSKVVSEELFGDIEQMEKMEKMEKMKEIIGIAKEKIKYLKKSTGLDEIETEEILFQIKQIKHLLCLLICLLRDLEIEKN